jgi:hypothetical protein
MKKIALVMFATIIGAAFFTSCQKKDPTPVATIDSLKIGLLAYYPFNNSGTDSSGKGNNVNYYSNITATTNRFNIPNTAFSFDGVSSYMTVADNTELRLSNTDFTTNLWVYMVNYSSSYGYELLVKRNAGTANGWNYGITGTANQINNGTALGVASFQLSGGSDPLALGTKVIGLNQWHMLTTVYNAQKKQITYYIDGILDNVSNNIPTPNPSVTSVLTIGNDSQTTNFTNYFFKGKLDDIRIYNRALTSASILKLYTLPY